jgi:hypothetical protein
MVTVTCLLSAPPSRTLIHGDKKGGFTVFWADDGLDTGPILLQRECDVEANDTVSTIYKRFLFPEGVKGTVSLLMEISLLVLLLLLLSHMALFHRWVRFGPRTPQPSSEGAAYSPAQLRLAFPPADSTLMVGWGLSRMAIAAAAT